MVWYPSTTPVRAIEDGTVLVEEGGIDPCGFGNIEDTQIVQLSISEEDWRSYCTTAESTNTDSLPVLFPSCGDVILDITDSETSSVGEDSDDASSTPTESLLQQEIVTANRHATAPVYNLGQGDEEVLYDEVQFRVEKPHDGCSVQHVHADFTVYAFQEWSRGSSGWHSSGENPLDDPDLSGCGFGELESLSAKRVTADGQSFLDLCRKLAEVGTSNAMLRRCGQVREFVTQ